MSGRQPLDQRHVAGSVALLNKHPELLGLGSVAEEIDQAVRWNA